MARHSHRRATGALLIAACGLLLSSCGGGGGDSNGGTGEFLGNIADAQACSPNNPYWRTTPGSYRAGSLTAEKSWLRAYMDQAYLWYDEVPKIDQNAAQFSDENFVYGSLDNYFNALLTPNRTPSNRLRDRFSFTYPTTAWDALSQSGKTAGYGIEWYFEFVNNIRTARIAYIDSGTPASFAGLQRGDELLVADNVAISDDTDFGRSVLNASLFPTGANQPHSFILRRGATQFQVSLNSDVVTKQPVPTTTVFDVSTPTTTKAVGYIVFNDHLATAEGPLIDAINKLKTAQVSDLVLDLRYNGGGFLYIASELAYMIAGPGNIQGRVFEQLQFNNKRSADTNSRDARTPFYPAFCTNPACTQTAPLPTLNLSKVFVITGAGTCSASESIINGLRGIGVTVQLIGDTTCGKPYGFTAHDNCGISYFPIEFKGVNAQGFGDYADGMSPAADCRFADDFSKLLGDKTEGLLSAALYAQANGGLCPPAAVGHSVGLAARRSSTGFLVRSPFRENRVLKPHP